MLAAAPIDQHSAARFLVAARFIGAALRLVLDRLGREQRQALSHLHARRDEMIGFRSAARFVTGGQSQIDRVCDRLTAAVHHRHHLADVRAAAAHHARAEAARGGYVHPVIRDWRWRCSARFGRRRGIDRTAKNRRAHARGQHAELAHRYPLSSGQDMAAGCEFTLGCSPPVKLHHGRSSIGRTTVCRSPVPRLPMGQRGTHARNRQSVTHLRQRHRRAG